MYIAQIAPLSERVPPKRYGGTERIVFALTEELVKRGHKVTLFASGDSVTSAKLVSVYPKNLREAKIHDPYGVNEWSLLNIGYAYKQAAKFDIIHDHAVPLSLPAANLSPTPVVATLHNPITFTNKVLYETMGKVNLVTVSQAQGKRYNLANVVGTVYNGLDFSSLTFGAKHRGYFLYVGRIALDKGVHLAIEVARYFNRPLIIAAKLNSQDQSYFREYIRPHLSDLIQWVGEVDENTRNQLYAGAYCLLHPVTWPEPFGLTMVEAMSSGCPVVAFNQGSIPEVVKEGVSGFVVNDIEEMIEAVDKLATIKREKVREYALSTFSAKRMVDAYEAIYQQILSRENYAFRNQGSLRPRSLPSHKPTLSKSG